MEQPAAYPGVSAQVQPVVQYPAPAGANPAQVLGYLQPITPEEIKQRHLVVTGFSGVDLVGQAGLEAQYDQALRGTPGTDTAGGNVTGTISQVAPKTGDMLVTSLDAKVQAVAQNALAAAIDKARAAGHNVNQGAAIVETTDGRIVAMASLPSYNPSIWTDGISDQEFKYLFGTSSGEPVINRNVQGQYAPGSTFKIVSTAAAVANGYNLNGVYPCPGTFSVHG